MADPKKIWKNKIKGLNKQLHQKETNDGRWIMIEWATKQKKKKKNALEGKGSINRSKYPKETNDGWLASMVSAPTQQTMRHAQSLESPPRNETLSLQLRFVTVECFTYSTTINNRRWYPLTAKILTADRDQAEKGEYGWNRRRHADTRSKSFDIKKGL